LRPAFEKTALVQEVTVTLKRWLLSLTLVLALTPVLSADPQETRGKDALRVLVILINQDDDFFSAQPGRGFDRELLEGFANLRHLRLEVIPQPSWDSLVPALLQKKGDLIAGRFTVTESRRKLIAFTSEAFPTRHVVLTRRPHRPLTTLEELRSQRVGTVKGTSMAEAVAAAGVPPANVDDGVPTGTLPEALRSGRVSAVVLGVENAISAQRLDPELELGLFLGPPGSLAYGVRKEDTELRQALSAYIDNLRRTPTWARLVVKYFGEAAPEILKKARRD
jgi:ABC-type amino acid transport substrate-binding protein